MIIVNNIDSFFSQVKQAIFMKKETGQPGGAALNHDIGIGIVENLLEEVGAENDHCISCNTCRIECPANIATSLLQPRKLVRMVNMGLLDELVRLPEIWYCLQCNRCSRICPMDVKPSVLIKHIRQQAIRLKIIDRETYAKYQQIGSRLQRVRWQVVAHLMNRKTISDELSEWREWADIPVPKSTQLISLDHQYQPLKNNHLFVYPSNLAGCMTCRECSTTCPIAFEQSVFDPVAIFHMANLGQKHELIKSPGIWLCTACESCTSACRQMVNGHLVLRQLKDLAIKEKTVPEDFERQLEKFNLIIYRKYQLEVDSIITT